MLRVSIESPWRAETIYEHARNEVYAKKAFFHSIGQSEAPFASHLFYTSLLDDALGIERRLGLDISHEWRQAANLIAFYLDLGWSPGMLEAKRIAQIYQIPTCERRIL